MNPDRIRIERLQAEIGLKRVALAEERASLQKLQSEIESFARQYARTIGSLEAQLDAIRQQIEALQTVSRPEQSSIWGPGFSSFEESFDAKYRRPQNPMISAPTPRAANEAELRSLYRQLARKYHPDTTTDPAEKARLTIIMAQVNAAYRAKNFDELQALDGQKAAKRPKDHSIAPPVVDPSVQREPTFFDLQKTATQLDEEIAWTRIAYQRLMIGPLMSLKIEASIARSQGRDLLRELAIRVKADLETAKTELAALRGSH
ncbi:MAG: J domain-containing protein [Chloroflexota bacterium]